MKTTLIIGLFIKMQCYISGLSLGVPSVSRLFNARTKQVIAALWLREP